MLGAVRATLSPAKGNLDGVGGFSPLARLRVVFDREWWVGMADDWGDWFLDDWDRAVQRSLTRQLSRRQWRTLRYQWRIGQGVKGGVLLLLFLLGFSLLLPDATAMRQALLLWCVGEELLLGLHIALGLRYGVSYGWGLHHARPLLLSGPSANYDLKVKGLLAAGVGVFLLQGLFALF